MKNISADSTFSKDTTVADQEIQVDFSASLLPRSAWNSHLIYLKVVFAAKKALDRIEKEPQVLNYVEL